MKKLEFKKTINAKPAKVWKSMLEKKTYEEWVATAWPNSTYKGEWKQGAEIRFQGNEGQGGTLAKIVELRENEYLKADHIAIIQNDGSLDSTSEQAKGWIGTSEAYTFTENNGKTDLTVTIETDPAWESMFTDGWPISLEKLKEIAERNTVNA